MTQSSIAATLEERCHDVVASWVRVERVRTGDYERSDKELADDLPELLQEIGQSLRANAKQVPRRAASAHARHRWLTGMSLERLTGEYVSLRQVLLDFLPPGIASTDKDCRLLHELLDDALGDCINVYVAHMSDALSKERQRFHVALQRAPIAIFEQDKDLRYVWAHPPEIADGLLGQRDEDVLEDEAALAVLTELKQDVLRTAEPRHTELALKRDGTQKHYQLWLEPSLGREGEVLGLVGASTDVTQSAVQGAMLRDALALRERVIGIVSHDLRNPLNAIELSAGSLLRKADTSERQRAVLQRLRQAAHRANRLISELLDYTRLRAGGLLPVRCVDCDARAVASQVVAEVAMTYPERKVTLTQPAEPLKLWADPDRLMQAVMNLVRNALQHSQQDSDVGVSVSAQADGQVSFAIRNAGEPIPQDELNHLFDPFVRGRSGVTVQDNVGLGLYIVQQITLAHGGKVDAESSAERGTIFTMTLPRTESREILAR